MDKNKEIMNLIRQIRDELEPVIEHLIDLEHDLNADHLLRIRDELLSKMENILENVN